MYLHFNNLEYSVRGLHINAAQAPVVEIPMGVIELEQTVIGEENIVFMFHGVPHLLVKKPDAQNGDPARLLSKHHLKRCEAENIAQRREAAARETREHFAPAPQFADNRPRLQNRPQRRG